MGIQLDQCHCRVAEVHWSQKHTSKAVGHPGKLMASGGGMSGHEEGQAPAHNPQHSFEYQSLGHTHAIAPEHDGRVCRAPFPG